MPVGNGGSVSICFAYVKAVSMWAYDNRLSGEFRVIGILENGVGQLVELWLFAYILVILS